MFLLLIALVLVGWLVWHVAPLVVVGVGAAVLAGLAATVVCGRWCTSFPARTSRLPGARPSTAPSGPVSGGPGVRSSCVREPAGAPRDAFAARDELVGP